MLFHLADVSLRSLIPAAAAGIFLLVCGSRASAALRHAVWVGVVLSMLLLLAFGQALPKLPLRILISPEPTGAGTSGNTAGSPGLDIEDTLRAQVSPPATLRRPIDWEALAFYAYLCGAFVFVARFATGIFLTRKFFAHARPISCGTSDGVFESCAVSVPVTAGLLRPRILLPEEWRDWDREKLNAVLAHEGAHLRRRDNLIAAVAGLNRSLFWFHPLAWFLERRLSLLADQACDDASVALIGDRDRYARLLLEMALVVDRSQGRLRRHALGMAAASHVRRRIGAIVEEGRSFSRGLSRKAGALLLVCGIPVVLCAGAIGFDRRPPVLRLEISRPAAPAPPVIPESLSGRPIRIAQAQAAPQAPSLPAAVPVSTPVFHTVTIKPCSAGDGAGRSGRGGAGGRGIPMSPPGELFINCMSVWELLSHSVSIYAPLLNDFGGPFQPERIRGGPAWIYSDLYTIDAHSSDPAANVQPGRGLNRILSGAMLTALLQDRFQLKFHRVTEDVPIYSLTVAASGFKLQPAEPGSCIPHEPGTPMPETSGQKPVCVTHGGWDGPNWTIDADAQNMAQLAGMLGGFIMDRPVLDKTGITGLFTFHLKFAHDATAPGTFPAGMSPFQPSDVPPAPPLAVVLEQQLGLNIVPDKGPREFLVIDSAQRPSIN